MKINFPTNLSDAREFQAKVAEKIILKDTVVDAKLIGALDVAYKEKKGFAAGIVYDLVEKKANLRDLRESLYLLGVQALFFRFITKFRLGTL